VRQPPDHRVASGPFAAAAPAPTVRLDDAACQHRSLRLKTLSGDFQAELVEPAERGQVGACESSAGSVRHVEVFRMGSVRTSILGRPRPLSAHRRAETAYTLNCEEPAMFALPVITVPLPADWARLVAQLLPDQVGRAMSSTSSSGGGLPVWMAFILFSAYIALGLGSASWLVQRRDA